MTEIMSERERIARIIDPEAWAAPANVQRMTDSRGRLTGYKLLDPPIFSLEHPIGASLAKADAMWRAMLAAAPPPTAAETEEKAT